MRHALLLSCALLFAPALASAQPGRSAPRMTDEARAHSEAGGRFFGLRRYDDAAREFQTAYALSGASELLFNLGRAYEEGARLREALDAYQRFRDAQPASFDATTLDARIADVQRRRAAQTAVATPRSRRLPRLRRR